MSLMELDRSVKRERKRASRERNNFRVKFLSAVMTFRGQEESDEKGTSAR